MELPIYFAVSIASVSTGVSDLGKQGVEWRRPRVAVPAILRASAQVHTIARSERPHRHVIWPRIGAQDRPVVALPAAHVERPHAVRAPRLHKVILVNDDYTPREFVVTVLKAEFRMSQEQAYRVMMTAYRRGTCVVAVYARDVAETKATRATEAGRSKGYPLTFTTELEE
jgi:ATP-dependent Clp protease adaptor protein ClpS